MITRIRQHRAGLPLVSVANLLTLFLLVSFLLQLPSCAGPAASLPPLPKAESGSYRLGSGDQVRIITFGEEQLTGDFRVGASGDITLPLAGPVHAAGLTPREFEQAVAQVLERSKLYKKPSVSVEVVSYRPIFILGEVNHPGQFPYQPEMTAVTAVAIAGGFTYRVVENVFSIIREQERPLRAGPGGKLRLSQAMSSLFLNDDSEGTHLSAALAAF